MSLPTTAEARTTPGQTPDLDTWRALARTSPAELNTRIHLALSLLRSRFDTDDPDVLAVIGALEGRSLEELAREVGA